MLLLKTARGHQKTSVAVVVMDVNSEHGSAHTDVTDDGKEGAVKATTETVASNNETLKNRRRLCETKSSLFSPSHLPASCLSDKNSWTIDPGVECVHLPVNKAATHMEGEWTFPWKENGHTKWYYMRIACGCARRGSFKIPIPETNADVHIEASDGSGQWHGSSFMLFAPGEGTTRRTLANGDSYYRGWCSKAEHTDVGEVPGWMFNKWIRLSFLVNNATHEVSRNELLVSLYLEHEYGDFFQRKKAIASRGRLDLGRRTFKRQRLGIPL